MKIVYELWNRDLITNMKKEDLTVKDLKKVKDLPGNINMLLTMKLYLYYACSRCRKSHLVKGGQPDLSAVSHMYSSNSSSNAESSSYSLSMKKPEDS